MLWLCLHLPQLPAEAQGLHDPLDAVTDSRGARRWLITAGAGLPVGLALGDALARCPALRAHPRKPAAERAALRALAQGLYRYGSPVATEIRELPEPGRAPRACVWIEIGASLRLFGGIESLCARLRADLAGLQQSAQLGIAPTRTAAALLACAGIAEPVLASEDLRARLEQLPVSLLAWPQAQLDALHGVGLRRLGDLFALPRAGFARRFGAEALLELDRLRGLAPDPVRGLTPPPQFRRRFDLAGEVEQLEGLLFPLRRISMELQAWLRARDTGLRSLELCCEHGRRRRSAFTLRFLSAHRDGNRIFDALRERLNRAPLSAPVRALLLRADDLGPVASGQAELFDGDVQRQLQWNETVERLLARLGESALWTPTAVEDHRPERACARHDVCSGRAEHPRSRHAGHRSAQPILRAHPGHPWPDGNALSSPRPGHPWPGARDRGDTWSPSTIPRPLWLLPQPQPLPIVPTGIGEPERIESGWWDGADARRDYHTIEWQNACAWVFRDHASNRWYLHGWWA
ncbi:DNA polymerase Y family protein [Fontimonas sp. SYSU GA230001]|uniref:Y-family DNA polymerase n=1 Tax=Fontimonas sp. SYSU GA230001 TaxID=3142450 RepID=UPI0032B60253